MKGRDKCDLLKEIRQKIADENNIEFEIVECDFEGECTGTCPKCEEELEYLNDEIDKKIKSGDAVKIKGIINVENNDDDDLIAVINESITNCDDDVELMGDIAVDDYDED